MKTVVILGAGATRAQSPKAAMKRRAPLDADFFKIARVVDRKLAYTVKECLEALVGEYADTLDGSLEKAATYLYIKAMDSRPRSAYHIGFLNLLELLNRVLGVSTNRMNLGPRTLLYRFLLSELKKLEKPEDFTIITFNYDIVIERTLEEMMRHGHPEIFNFPGCYRMEKVDSTHSVRGLKSFSEPQEFEHAGVGVLKLHGSMNWYSKHKSDTPSPSALFNPKRQLHVTNATYLPSNLSWRRNARRVYLKPVIVPPVTGKRGMMHEDILKLWKRASLTLKQADRLVFAGYSCPPLDLEARILLSENVRANNDKKVYVIDPCSSVVGRFVDLCGVNHSSFYTSLDAWVRDAVP